MIPSTLGSEYTTISALIYSNTSPTFVVLPERMPAATPMLAMSRIFAPAKKLSPVPKTEKEREVIETQVESCVSDIDSERRMQVWPTRRGMRMIRGTT